MSTYNFSHEIYNVLQVEADSKEEAVDKLLSSEDWDQFTMKFQAIVYNEDDEEVYNSGIRQ